MELDRVALDLRHEEVVLDLLDQEVQEQRGQDRGRAVRGGQEHRRHGRDDRPDDRDELEQAGDDRQQDGIAPEDREPLAEHDQPDEGGDADDETEDQLAAHPLAEVALDGLDHGPRVEPPRLRHGAIELGDQGHPVLEDVGDPDGEDEVGEQRAEQAPGAGDERQEERQAGAAAAATAALADARHDAVDPVAERDGDLEALVELAQVLELLIELGGQLREVLDEAHDLVDQRRQGEGQELDEQHDPDDVHQDDRVDPADPATDEPAHRRLEQVDEQQAEDERADAVARHPQDQPGDDGRGDEDRRRVARAGRTAVRPGRRSGR